MTINPVTEPQSTSAAADHQPVRQFPADSRLAAYFAERRSGLPEAGEAFARVEQLGLPTRRVEEWKYTDLRALLSEAAAPASRPDAATVTAALAGARVFDNAPGVRVDFVNGHLAHVGALPAGVTVVPFAQALAQAHPALSILDRIEAAQGNTLVDLNTAFLDDGIVVHVTADADVGEALHLRFVNHGEAPFSTAVRVLVTVDDGAALTIAETHEGNVAAQPNDLVAFAIGKGARVEHVRVNAEAEGAIALSTLAAALDAEAELRSFNLVAGALASRHQLFLVFAGENARATLGGVTVIAGDAHADTTLVVDHAVPGGESRELYKTVVGGDATGVFQGKIVVRRDAQKTDGRMMSAAVLLSPGATMYNKPELEIWADDVQCAHGATCGELDEDLLFYLKARGLPPVEAEALLLQAFIGEAIELVENETMRNALSAIAVKRLENRS